MAAQLSFNSHAATAPRNEFFLDTTNPKRMAATTATCKSVERIQLSQDAKPYLKPLLCRTRAGRRSVAFLDSLLQIAKLSPCCRSSLVSIHLPDPFVALPAPSSRFGERCSVPNFLGRSGKGLCNPEGRSRCMIFSAVRAWNSLFASQICQRSHSNSFPSSEGSSSSSVYPNRLILDRGKVCEEAKNNSSLSSFALTDASSTCSCAEEVAVLPGKSTMTANSGLNIVDGQLLVQGKSILRGVPENIVLNAATDLGAVMGAFIGASSDESKSRHVFKLGVLQDMRFMCCFRFKLWWMTQTMGTCGKEVPLETQFLLLESKGGSPFSAQMDSTIVDQTIYTVFLPLLEDSFRSSLQGNEKDELELCLESGDPAVQSTGGHQSLFVHACADPFQVISEAVKAVEMHLQTFRHREKKKMPSMLDWFGWCTWDAFYTDVTADGVREGLKSLEEGGTPARFIIIDDGWQSVGTDQHGATGEVTAGTQLARRLTHIKENHKFQKDGRDGMKHEDPALGLQHIVHEVKEKHNLKYVYVWHAITGYWGGVKPGIAGMEHYESVVKFPSHSPGVLSNQPDLATDSLTINGLGLVHPKKAFQFYDELHSYLATAGVDGVKVDVQNILETLGAGFGGRVSITRQYHQALQDSVARNFPDNGCIACMSHNTDGLYNSMQTAVVRASDDFWPRDPASHTIHIASVAYNSLFLGEFMQPDWDMFHSLHPAAEYHAAARAVGGCAIYVSDKPGNHDFDLLKRLVLPDGSVLRSQLPGRPTRDCLFCDPTKDGKSLLKIWNMNKYTGVVGAFNCQGAGWSRVAKINVVHDAAPGTITGSIHARDIELLVQAAAAGWSGDCAIYSHRGGELVRLPRSAALPVTLKVLEYEMFTISPVKTLAPGVDFAPIGLTKMFNSGGAIVALDFQLHDMDKEMELVEQENDTSNGILPLTEGQSHIPIATIKMKIHGCGQFGVYSSWRPRQCLIDSGTVEFLYDPASGLVTFFLPVTKAQLQEVTVEV